MCFLPWFVANSIVIDSLKLGLNVAYLYVFEKVPNINYQCVDSPWVFIFFSITNYCLYRL